MNNFELNRLFSNCICLASLGHREQFRSNREPYILHCLRVMNNVETTEQKIVAVLHDILEDTHLTTTDLYEENLSNKMVNAIVTLTHIKDESYIDYIQRIKKNELARAVKLADLKDNMNCVSLDDFGKYEGERLAKYWRAYKELTG